jgi:ABC-type sugar transport system permease subunit
MTLTLEGARAAPRRRWRMPKAATFYLFAAPFAALTIVMGLWPIALSIQTSFTESYTALSPEPTWIGFGNYAEIFSDPVFLQSAWLTLRYTALAVVANLLIALFYAMFLSSRAIPRWAWVFKLCCFLPVVTPDVAGYIVWKWMYSSDFGAVNAVLEGIGLPPFGGISDVGTVTLAILIAETWYHVGFYVVIFLANFAMLDPALDEAATMDNAGPWRRFTKVTLPQLRPAITINTVYALIQFLKTFTVVVVITKGGPGTATNFVSYYAYRQFDQAQYGTATAMATVLFATIMVMALGLYWFNQRRDWR